MSVNSEAIVLVLTATGRLVFLLPGSTIAPDWALNSKTRSAPDQRKFSSPANGIQNNSCIKVFGCVRAQERSESGGGRHGAPRP